MNSKMNRDGSARLGRSWLVALVFCVLTLLMTGIVTVVSAAVQMDQAAQAAPPAMFQCAAPEIANYDLVYNLAIPVEANYDEGFPPYSVDNSAATADFDRVGYCLQLDEDWIWVSMDAFTNDPIQLGVPVISTGAVFQQTVSNMTVASNVPGIVTGTGIATGNIEFWHNCYGQLNALGIPGASDTSYDFGDRYLTTDWPPSCYGSMQLHNYGARQTLFAYNQWDAAAPDKYDDLGIGNDPQLSRTRYHPDWTYSGLEGFDGTETYTTRNLYVMVHPHNHPPTTVNDEYEIAANDTLNVPVPGVLDNDDDFDADQLTAELINDVNHGKLTLEADGSLIYDSDGAFVGQDSFTYQAHDGQDYSDEATVTIDVTCTLPHDVYHELDLNTAIACVNSAGPGTHTINLLANIGLSASAIPFDNATATEIIVEGNDFMVDGNNRGTVFTVAADTIVRIQNITITGGYGSGHPIDRKHGGALYNEGVVTFDHAQLVGNYAPQHGGAALNYGTLTIRDSTVANNSASGWGGGIHNSYGTLIVDRSTFKNNTSQGGGAIENYRSVTGTMITNSTIAGNSSWNLSTNSSNMTIVNSTISSGSALLTQSEYSMPKITISNSIVLGSCGNRGSATYVDGGANLGSGSSCGFTPVGPYPTLGPLQDNGGPTWSHAFLPGSSGIDGVIPPAICTTTSDQRGVSRPQGNYCDIGAFELENQPPLADAGGPYDGFEGSPIVLDGSGSSDPDGNALTFDWDVASTLCQFDVDTAEEPNLTCSDNVNTTVTLTVDDGQAGDSDTVTVDVLNVAPAVNLPAVSPEPSHEGGLVTASASFVDPGYSDSPFTCTFDYGNGPQAGSVSGTTCTGPEHAYADNGAYTVIVVVTDKDGAAGGNNITHIVNNVAPTVSLTGADAVDEDWDGIVSYSYTVSDPGADSFTLTSKICGDGGVLSNSNFDPDTGAGSFDCTFADGPKTTLTTLVGVTVSDDDGGSGTDSILVTVNNVAPTIEDMTVPWEDPVNINEQAFFTVDVTFSDPAGAHDERYTCEFDMSNDGLNIVTVAEVSGTSCSAALNYAEPGVHTAKVTVTDKDEGFDSEIALQYIVIYDPDGGFVTGGGWINSPEGAYTPDPTLTGKANFGFVAKYKKGQSTPDGNTEFQFKAGDLNFHSDSYDWLVIAGKKAMFKGTGTINGSGNYGLMLSVVDEKLTPSTDVDLFRIKIWDKDNGDGVVYDNNMGAAEDVDPDTAIGGGSIVIHKK